MDIALESLKYLKKSDNLKIYSYVILENHLHMILKSDDLSATIKKFKRHTAKEIIKLLQTHSAKTILDQFAFYKKAHKKNTTFQVWEEGCAPKLISGYEMMRNKIEYIHYNPVKRGFVDTPDSSARNYMGNKGLIEIDLDWS